MASKLDLQFWVWQKSDYYICDNVIGFPVGSISGPTRGISGEIQGNGRFGLLWVWQKVINMSYYMASSASGRDEQIPRSDWLPERARYISLTKREGRTGRISARGLDSTDRAQRGPYKKDRGPIFSQYGPEQAWLIRDLLHDWRKLLRFFTNYGFHLCYLSRSYSVFPLLELGTIIRPAFENF